MGTDFSSRQIGWVRARTDFGTGPRATRDHCAAYPGGRSGAAHPGLSRQAGHGPQLRDDQHLLYSVYGQGGGTKHKNDPAIANYRNSWIDAIFAASSIEAVISLGQLADGAFQQWKATPKGQATNVVSVHITHPTQPESSAGNNKVKHAAAIKAMLQNWNAALPTVKAAIQHPDRAVALALYGERFVDGDEPEIPELDMPGGLPAWMRGAKNWATRTGATAALKRVTITVTIPTGSRPA